MRLILLILRCWILAGGMMVFGGMICAQEAIPSVAQRQPFHLKAVFTEGDDPDFATTMTVDWAGPNKWRRTLESKEFSQSIVVNGGKVQETESNPYVPLAIETLVTAVVSPLAPMDGMDVPLNVPGHMVAYRSAMAFDGRPATPIVIYSRGMGESSIVARILEIRELADPNPNLFDVTRPTQKKKQLQTTVLPEAGLRKLMPESHEIIWPQVVDGTETGKESFYVSVDMKGHVQEVLPVNTVNERTNEPAERQIHKWKFKRTKRNGRPSQVEGILTFDLNTREYGPKEPLTDAEVRKLATNRVDPMVPPGTFSSGTTKLQRVSIDTEGRLIEEIGGDGPGNLAIPCLQAVQQWKFRPIMERGKPRPYRATIVCRIP